MKKLVAILKMGLVSVLLPLCIMIDIGLIILRKLDEWLQRFFDSL